MIDVIIISEAITPALHRMTQQAIDSAHQCTQAPVSVIVVERTQHLYRNAVILHDEQPFNYNRLVNLAIRNASTSHDIVVANNDVEFLKGSIPIMAQSRPLVVSPVDPSGPVSVDGIEFGTQVARHFMGWCFLIRRKIWDYLGGFNEIYPFWCADNVVVDQLKSIGVTPAICGDAKVYHHVSATLNLRSFEEQNELTQVALKRYNQGAS